MIFWYWDPSIRTALFSVYIRKSHRRLSPACTASNPASKRSWPALPCCSHHQRARRKLELICTAMIDVIHLPARGSVRLRMHPLSSDPINRFIDLTVSVTDTSLQPASLSFLYPSYLLLIHAKSQVTISYPFVSVFVLIVAVQIAAEFTAHLIC